MHNTCTSGVYEVHNQPYDAIKKNMKYIDIFNYVDLY